MSIRALNIATFAAIAAILTSRSASAQEGLPPAPAVAAEPGAEAEVLDQGPIHEAFAEPVVLRPGQGLLIQNEPPEPVNELPPDVRPEGNNVEWIPGYWMWSDQQQDFIWVSGVWRDVPPGRRWVPGHWLKADGGYSWTPGFWTGGQVQQVDMLPLPPDTLEAGPSSPAPGDNYFWIPGCWNYRNDAYFWRTGYWYAGQANWLWVPDHYCYTPSGAFFVSGYWDYPLARRGLLYAPVWWSRPIYARPGYFYRPYSVVNTALLLTALFVNDHHHHYYYGYGGWRNNYYRPWWNYGYGGRHHVYDPFFAYHRWHDGHNHNDWVDRVRRDFDRHQHDFAQHHGRQGNGLAPGGGRGPGGQPGHQLVRNINEVRRDNDLPVNLREVSGAERDAVQARVQDFKRTQDARRDALAKFAQNARVGSGDSQNADGGGPRLAAGSSHGKGDAGQSTAGRNSAPGARTAFRLPPVERGINDPSPMSGGNAPGSGNSAVRGHANFGRSAQSNGVVAPGAEVRPTDRLNRPDYQAPRRGNFGSTQNSQQARSRVVVPGADPDAPSGNQVNLSGSSRMGTRHPRALSGNNIPDDSAPAPNSRPQYRPGASNDAASELRARMQQYPNSRSAGDMSPAFRGVVPGNAQQQLRSFRPPADSGPRRSIQIPPGGGESRSFRVPSGGGQPRQIQIPPVGGGEPSNIRSFPGSGRPNVRGTFGGDGGGQPNVRSFQGGGGGRPAMRGNFGGGGGHENRGGGGGRGKD